MKLTIILIALLFGNTSYCQLKEKLKLIDSLAIVASEKKENYRYWYGYDNSLLDFRMDSINREIIRVSHKVERNDTFLVNYYFKDNFLIKVQSFRIKSNKLIVVANYYFENNILVSKKGKKLNLESKGYMHKISKQNITKQLCYLYSQYLYISPRRNNQDSYTPLLLEIERQKINERESQ